MTSLINRLADKAHELETEEEILCLIEGASIATGEDYATLKKKVQNAYHIKYNNTQTTSTEAVYNCGNIN